MNLLVPVILSGGAGSRLWPVSREGHPKPFMKLADGQTLLEKTYRRAANLPDVLSENGKSKILTVTNRNYYFMSRDELAKASAEGAFLLEPFGRNTAPAIALAAHRLLKKYGDDVIMLVLPSDHLIGDEAAFSVCVKKACHLAKDGYLVTFGITPTAPEIGFGYIEQGQAITDGFLVKRFVEKPDAQTAQQYLDAGDYLWNSGMFCFKAKTFLEELRAHSPKIADHAAQCWDAVPDNGNDSTYLEIPEAVFDSAPNDSIDYALMEKSNKVAVVPGSFGWNDIGSWNAVRDLAIPDAANNRAIGEAIFINSSNTFIQSEDRLVAAVGLNNLMIIDTPDALLVANPDYAQDVKAVVSKLKELGHDAAKLHKTVARPWGTYTVLEDHPGFKIKRIEVKPGGKLSLQMHHHRSEHWIVVKGQAQVVNGDESITLLPNQSTYIPAGHKHRLSNPIQEDLVMIEVQCGGYLGEDDIVRFEDNYGRA
ncbi:mannose-1-phosphate guanylyltransferase/mannose-6-phosphate isomerase [Polynucleobacter sp. JS-Safj-400b-B2]|uniref:mannose-1-phosphate guanylyltransferase/mannose-6-phosphate isomerase n=1 Tax=Polynucleobacter sp. JS-Safj-400b-B2 TaxID=2576921 RepID=UPI001C0AE1CB|nr:mannose-1-phosphate guanylyltransferase/mannose-6-phosphate isomerase [Polynucleobacter sp. JS-Safj-400b-B2]MBU3625053.1 mannose-1-phosphate guanylyltransferase/mannose-6-phosphate isomerase [Polynucleobacter sp. JS-Safj-400b-B2]